MLDILIENGTILTMDEGRRILKDGSVAIKKDRIIDVGDTKDLKEKYGAKEVINAKNKVVMPGLIDAHAHAGHGLIKTICEHRGDEWERFANRIYRHFADEGFWYIEGLLSAVERLKFGTTCGVSFLGGGDTFRSDDPVFADMHAKAINEVGIRDIMAIGPSGIYYPLAPTRFSTWKGTTKVEREVTFEESIKTTEKVLEKWSGSDEDRVRASIALNRVSPSSIEVKHQDIPMVIEQAREIRRVADRYKVMILSHAHSGEIEFTYRHHPFSLGTDVQLVHCDGISEEEIRILAKTGTKVAHCPSARAIISGRCPVVELLDAGVNVAIGSDASSPDRTYCLFKDMRLAMRYQQTYFKSSNYLPPGKVLEMVTIDAARNLGLDDLIGSLEAGKKADIILLDMFKPHLIPFFMPAHRVVYEASGSDVDTVIVDGRILMRNRQITSVDEAEILRNAQEQSEKIIDDSGSRSYMEIPKSFWRSSKYPSQH